MKKQNFLKEIPRDVIALGSPIFLLLVTIRILIIPRYDYASQFIFAGIIFLILMYFFKANIYSGFGLIILTFTALFYNHDLFTVFGIIAYFALITSLIYMKESKNSVLNGIIFGLISSGISYYLVELLFE